MKSDIYDDNFVCMICTQIAYDAVQTHCCGQIMCEVCVKDLTIKGHQTCPNCRQILNVKPSALARRIISTIKIACDQCDQKYPHKQLKNHKRKCHKRIIKCKDCSKQIRVGIITDHMKQDHFEKLIQICQQYQLGLEEDPSLSKISSNSDKIVQSKIKNITGRQSHLGTTGKYYCGERALIGKCLCCDGRCGPTNGQNCDDCMQMDVKRFNLPKGFLINTSGIVCKADPGTTAFYCGRMNERQFCSKVKPCNDCTKMKNAIKIGRYRKLI